MIFYFNFNWIVLLLTDFCGTDEDDMTHGSYNVVQRILGMNVQFEVSSVAPRGFTS